MTEAEAFLWDDFKRLFLRYQAAKDVSPADRYRLEGKIECSLTLLGMTVAEIEAIRADAYREVFAEPIAFSGLPWLPAIMTKAPVRPST